MWPSPSKIPTNVSFTSSVIKALSAEDKRLIPFVEAKKTKLASIKEIRVFQSCYLHWTISSIKKLKVSCIASEDPIN